MHSKKTLIAIFAAFGMLMLILDSNAAFDAAEKGVDLCLRIILPSIFPFLVLSIFLNDAMLGINIPFLNFFTRTMGIPQGTETILISAFLGGYPTGAQAVAQHYESGIISKETAEKLLAFTNNAGPAFIFGMISHVFSQRWIPWALWIIQIISAFCVSQLLIIPYDRATPFKGKNSGGAMERAIKITASVCGWVILFRIIIDVLARKLLPALPPAFTALLTGILELSNGCLALDLIPDISTRFLLCCALLSFGGLCITMQTFSVVKSLKMKYYFIGKAMQTAFSIILGIAFIGRQWYLIPIILISAVFIRSRKNKCGNNVPLRV